jgi:flagellar hook assembly protein FlgD
VYYNLEDTALIGISGGRNPDPAGPQRQNLFPNPFSRQIKLSAEGDGRQDRVVKIYNIAGALKRTIDWPASAGDEITWNGLDSRGSFVPAGIYLVRVQGGKTTRCYKIIKLP